MDSDYTVDVASLVKAVGLVSMAIKTPSDDVALLLQGGRHRCSGTPADGRLRLR
jgi:hypothetical protein